MTGEEEALIDELFTRYRTAMLGRALQYMKHVQDAEDVVSDAWMSLLRQLPKLVVMDERALHLYSAQRPERVRRRPAKGGRTGAPAGAP